MRKKKKKDKKYRSIALNLSPINEINSTMMNMCEVHMLLCKENLF